MTDLIVSVVARNDLLLGYNWLRTRNPGAAERLLEKIKEKFELARRVTGIGARRDEYIAGLRCVFVKPYTIYYTQDSDVVTVIRVLHERRDHAAELK